MKEPVIKVGFCVAYDWELLKKSVLRIYNHADVICFSLDKNRKSWSGNTFKFDSSAFYSWVSDIDKDHKISILEEAFYQEGLQPIENDNRQRKLMADFLGKGGWHIQIDSDEYFFDFSAFKDYLLKMNSNPSGDEKAINICCNWISLIKQVAKGFLFVHNRADEYETMPFATNVPEYLNARRNSHFNHISPFFVLHETWARGEDQLLEKINSWGHDKDFLSKESYFSLWKALDEYNYCYIKNFHPLKSHVWQALEYVPRREVDEVIDWLKKSGLLKLNWLSLSIQNNRIVQGLMQRFGI